MSPRPVSPADAPGLKTPRSRAARGRRAATAAGAPTCRSRGSRAPCPQARPRPRLPIATLLIGSSSGSPNRPAGCRLRHGANNRARRERTAIPSQVSLPRQRRRRSLGSETAARGAGLLHAPDRLHDLVEQGIDSGRSATASNLQTGSWIDREPGTRIRVDEPEGSPRRVGRRRKVVVAQERDGAPNQLHAGRHVQDERTPWARR